MKKISAAQQQIIDVLNEGKILSSLLRVGSQDLFGAEIEECGKRPSIASVKVMLKCGFIQESKRWCVSADLWHIEYALVQRSGNNIYDEKKT